MSKNIEKTESTAFSDFQERVQNKVREDVAQMLPDEVIDEMVKKATNNLFFTKYETVKRTSFGGEEKKTYESYFEARVLEAAKPLVAERVAEMIKEQDKLIKEKMIEAIDKGLMGMAMKHLDNVISQIFLEKADQMSYIIAEKIRSSGF